MSDYIDQYSARVMHNSQGEPHNVSIMARGDKLLHATLEGDHAVVTSLRPVEGDCVVYGEDVMLQLEVLQNLDCVTGWSFATEDDDG